MFVCTCSLRSEADKSLKWIGILRVKFLGPLSAVYCVITETSSSLASETSIEPQFLMSAFLVLMLMDSSEPYWALLCLMPAKVGSSALSSVFVLNDQSFFLLPSLTIGKVDGEADGHPDDEAHPGEPVEVDDEGDVEEDGEHREEGHKGHLVAQRLAVLLVLRHDPHHQNEKGGQQTEEEGDQLVVDALRRSLVNFKVTLERRRTSSPC